MFLESIQLKLYYLGHFKVILEKHTIDVLFRSFESVFRKAYNCIV